MANASRSELIARAELLLPPHRAEPTIPGRSDDLEEHLLNALVDLAMMAKTDADIRRQLTKQVPFTLTAQSDFATSDAALADVLPEAYDMAELYVAGFAGPASFHREYQTFQMVTPKPGIARWTVAEGRILVRGAGAGTASKTCLLRNAIFIPSVVEANPATNTLPVGLEDNVVRLIVNHQLQKIAGGAAAGGTP